MKRLAALFLVMCLLLSLMLTGCGGDSSNSSSSKENTEKTDTNKGDKTQNDDSVGEDDSDSAQGSDDKDESNQSGAEEYMTFDDLPYTQYFSRFPSEQYAVYNYPAMREDSCWGGYTYTLSSGFDIIAAKQDSDLPAYDGAIDGMYEELMPMFIRTLGDVEGEDFYNNLYEGLDVTTSIVTLDNGIQAVKFEGTQNDLGQDYIKYDLYGYLLVYGEYNLAFAYSVEIRHGEMVADVDVKQLQEYVDHMVLTLRSKK